MFLLLLPPAAGAAAGSELRDRDVVLEALEERQARFGRVRAALRDPRRTAFVFVTTAERLPVAETHRVVMALGKAGIPVGGLIVNQILPDGSRDSFLASRKVRETSQLLDIEEKFARWPIVRIPLLDRDPVGRDDLLDLLSRMVSDREEDSR